MTESPADFDLDSGVSKQRSIESTPASAVSRKRTLRMFRPRFSVRTFILLTTLATIGLGLFLQLERPRQVRIWIHRNGGECELETNDSSGLVENWLRKRLPREYFDSVVKAKLRTLMNNEIVDRLGAFSDLRWLRMDNSQFRNDHLHSLSKMKRLEVLYLHNTSLDDVGMAYISKLRMLRELRVDRTRITDRSIGHLLTLTNLEVLYLNDNLLNDVAIAELHRLTKLKCLHLENTGVSVSAIQTLKEVLPNCLILGP